MSAGELPGTIIRMEPWIGQPVSRAVSATAEIDLAATPPFICGPLRLRPRSRLVGCGGTTAVLEPRVMQVLVLLARHEGEVVSRAELQQSCWGGRHVSKDALNRCILQLRKLVSEEPGVSIETVSKVGYRLMAPNVPRGVVRPVGLLRWAAAAGVVAWLVLLGGVLPDSLAGTPPADPTVPAAQADALQGSHATAGSARLKAGLNRVIHRSADRTQRVADRGKIAITSLAGRI